MGLWSNSLDGLHYGNVRSLPSDCALRISYSRKLWITGKRKAAELGIYHVAVFDPVEDHSRTAGDWAGLPRNRRGHRLSRGGRGTDAVRAAATNCSARDQAPADRELRQ